MTKADTHLHIEGISKSFASMCALNEIDLKIERGSFVCLLGPSGCGKTTLLRIIAGFETASAGRLLLDGADISQVPPHKRGFGMVFQSLALFPHMTVAENIAYGLKLRGVKAAARQDRIDELLHVIELPHIADRAVSALSGGQRQRVAIARALAVQPQLFLLDEPLSALDAKLRDNMQIELRQLQRKFGVTTILVTHDQHEAMMLADTLVVMKNGQIRQADDPATVFRQPADPFVADFLGAANLLPGTATAGGFVSFLGAETAIRTTARAGAPLQIALRAEQIDIVSGAAAAGMPAGRIEFVRDLGASMEWIVAVGPDRLRVRSGAHGTNHPVIGQDVGLAIKTENLAVFEP